MSLFFHLNTNNHNTFHIHSLWKISQHASYKSCYLQFFEHIEQVVQSYWNIQGNILVPINTTYNSYKRSGRWLIPKSDLAK